MAARSALVSQIEIKRTLQATLSAGLRIGRVEVCHATGTVVVILEGAAAQAAGPDLDELFKGVCERLELDDRAVLDEAHPKEAAAR